MFTQRTIYAASLRQDRKDGFGPYCAKCCRNIGPIFGHDAVPRIPIAKGGKRNIENCVIVCRKCFVKIGLEHPEVIPKDELPCYSM